MKKVKQLKENIKPKKTLKIEQWAHSKTRPKQGQKFLNLLAVGSSSSLTSRHSNLEILASKHRASSRVQEYIANQNNFKNKVLSNDKSNLSFIDQFKFLMFKNKNLVIGVIAVFCIIFAFNILYTNSYNNQVANHTNTTPTVQDNYTNTQGNSHDNTIQEQKEQKDSSKLDDKTNQNEQKLNNNETKTENLDGQTSPNQQNQQYNTNSAHKTDITILDTTIQDINSSLTTLQQIENDLPMVDRIFFE